MICSLIQTKDDKAICNFCHNVCHVYLDNCWKCLTCHVWYDTFKNIINFFALENNRMYTIRILLKDSKSLIYAYNNGNYNLISSFDCVLNITPANLQTKLKTYLLLL